MALVLVWLAYGKFYSLFSLLFGIGFALQLDSAARDGDARLGRFKRRLAILLAIGLIHLTFIWEGDILALYAMIGFLLVPFRRLSQRSLLVTAAILIGLPIVQQLLIVLSSGALDPGAPLMETGRRWQQAMGFGLDAEPYPILKEANLAEAAWFQLSGFWFRYADLLTTARPFKVLALFLLGLWVGRSGILRDLDAAAPLLARVRRWGFAVGLPAALVQAVLLLTGTSPTSPLSIVESLAYALGVAPLGLAYAAHVGLLWRRQVWRDRLSLVIPAGRMALTNYLSADGHCHRSLLRHRPRLDGRGRPDTLASHRRRGRRRPVRGQLVVARALPVRSHGMALARPRTAGGQEPVNHGRAEASADD